MESIFSENLRKLRTERKLTQEQVAEKLNVSAQAVSRWECASTFPDILLLPKIALLYGVTVDDLFQKHPAVYENLAQRMASIYEQSDDPEDFFSAIREFQRIEPGKRTAMDRWLYGMIHQKMMFHCRDEAFAQMEQLIAQNTKVNEEMYWKARRQKIYLQVHGGGAKEAIRDQLERTKKVRNPQEWLTLAAGYFYCAEWENALVWCQKIIDEFPEWEEVGLTYCLAGDACKSLGKKEAAVANWDRAAAAGCMDACFSKAFFYEETEDFTLAYEQWSGIVDELERQGYVHETAFPRKKAEAMRMQLGVDFSGL